MSEQIEHFEAAQLPIARAWVPQALASLAERGSELTLPLSVFFCESIRRQIEERLEVTDQYPQWDRAKRTVDERGRAIRLVPVLRLAALPS